MNLRSLFFAACLAGVPVASATEHQCFLFENPNGYPVVHLGPAAIDSAGTAMSDRNMELIDRIEEAYANGRYGKIGSKDARSAALAALTFQAETAFDYFLSLTLQHDAIYSTSERDLLEAFTSRFRNPGLYPIVNLLDARAGFGRFCVMFEVESEGKREIRITGESMYAWTERLEMNDSVMPVVNIDMKTMSHDRVHVVYEEYSCGSVTSFETEMDGRAVRVSTMENLHGQYVRKWGFHRPEAVVLWKSITEGLEAPPESERFLGSAIYFPNLQLKLPWFLPDLGFDDLRRFDFPEPLLTLDAVKSARARKLDWLEIKKNFRFKNWETEGDIPDAIATRFPDK